MKLKKFSKLKPKKNQIYEHTHEHGHDEHHDHEHFKNYSDFKNLLILKYLIM